MPNLVKDEGVTAENHYHGISRVVRLDEDEGQDCEECGQTFGFDEIAASINHYLERHSYRLLHVGTQTSQEDDDKIWHTTVAIVGK